EHVVAVVEGGRIAGRRDRLRPGPVEQVLLGELVHHQAYRGRHEPRQERERQRQPDAQAHPGRTSLYPAPRTVSMASAPILPRSRRTCMSTSRVSPDQTYPHTFSSSCSRVSTIPPFSASSSRSRYSVAVSESTRPSRVTTMPFGSISRSPKRSRPPSASRVARRRTARSRAARIGGSKGFVT